jgi:hypothetical protein
MSLRSSGVSKCLEKKLSIFGFEIPDLLAIFLTLSILNFVFGQTSLKFPLVWFPTILLSLALYFGKRGKPENYLIHWLRFQIAPGIFSAFPEPRHWVDPPRLHGGKLVAISCILGLSIGAFGSPSNPRLDDLADLQTENEMDKNQNGQLAYDDKIIERNNARLERKLELLRQRNRALKDENNKRTLEIKKGRRREQSINEMLAQEEQYLARLQANTVYQKRILEAFAVRIQNAKTSHQHHQQIVMRLKAHIQKTCSKINFK